MAGDEVVAAAVGIEVAEVVGQVAVEGGTQGLSSRPSKTLARQILHSARKTCNTERTTCACAYFTTEGKNIGAVASDIAQVAPTGVDSLGATTNSHNLAERHTDIDGIAIGH